MDETLYSARDVAHIFALKESRVLYWARTGFVGPSVKRAGRLWFTFQDLISVKAAKELLVTLKPMLLPYDVALERGWSTGVETFSALENLADFSPHRADTTIGKRMHYRAVKRHFLLRVTAHWFRTCDQLRRWRYAISVKA